MSENDVVFDALFEKNYGVSFGQDPRFVNTHDQQRWCWTLFNDYLRCKHKLTDEAPRCQYLKVKSNAVCPLNTLSKWNDAIDEGRWWGFEADKKEEH